jgi:serine/threonine-protein kinase
VADYNGGVIQEYVPGTATWSVNGGLSGEPDGVAVLPSGTLLYVDYMKRRVFEYATSWTIFGAFIFNVPQGMTADNLGNVFVDDTQNNRVLLLDSMGNVITQFGNGQLNNPYGVVVDNLGSAYVADFNNARVVVYSYTP